MAKRKVKKTAGKAKKDRYTCNVCGLLVTVDNVCGCVDTCDIMCCGKSMQSKK